MTDYRSDFDRKVSALMEPLSYQFSRAGSEEDVVYFDDDDSTRYGVFILEDGAVSIVAYIDRFSERAEKLNMSMEELFKAMKSRKRCNFALQKDANGCIIAMLSHLCTDVEDVPEYMRSMNLECSNYHEILRALM